ncbi:MAG: hypothetical protein LBU26_00465 [Synergistaceae bacterium]|jgi:hypothetical protein|nr:hypothetical protein [Synergistaceae bacterium]
MRKIAMTICLMMFAVCPREGAASPAIQFPYEPEEAPALSADLLAAPFYPELDGAKYSAACGRYLIKAMAIPLKSGDEYRMMLTCDSLDKSGACLGIKLVIVDERKTPAAMIQRFGLGDGYAPTVVFAPEDARNVMFRAIRAGDNTEARVYSINPVTGRFDEKLAVARAFPDKMKLKITAVMKPGGMIEAESKNPVVKQIADMSGALGALVEDELYQPDGNPMPALENLRLVRSGWEDENIYRSGGETMLNVGMSMITLSKKPVLDVTAVMRMDEHGNWFVSDVRFEPSLPYRSE